MRNCMTLNNLGFHRSSTLARAAGLALALAALSAGPGGCNRDDQVAAGIEAASRKLAAVSPGATASATPDLDASTYRTVLTDLKSVSGKGGDGQQAAVDLLIARVQFGLAGQAAAGAAELEHASLRAGVDVRASLQQYLSYDAQASALSVYDPAPSLADLDQQIADREADLAKARKAKQDVDARVAALRAQAQAKMDQAAAEHKIEAELRQQAIRGSNTEAALLIAGANQHRRVADGFDVEAATLDAQAAQFAPESPEAQLAIDQRTNQRDQLGKAREEVTKRDADNRALAARTRADQAAAAEAVDTAAKALAAVREGELPKRYDEAARLYGEAAASANKAIKGSKSQASLALAEARQALGDLAWARAQGIAAQSATLESLATAKPALPQQAEYAQAVAALVEAQQQSLTAATESYQAAKSSYESSGLKGDGAARLEDLAKGLTGTILKTSGGAVDLRSNDAPSEPAAEPAEGDGSAPDAAPTISADSPQSTLTMLLAAADADKFEEAFSHVYAPPGPMRDIMTSALEMLTKIHLLDEACQAKIGQRLSDDPNSIAGQARKNGVGLRSASGGDIDPASLTYTVTGETATAAGPDLSEPIKFRREAGRWLVDGSDSQGTDAGNMQVAAMMIPMLSKAIDSVTVDVQAGKFKTLDEVNMALMAKMGPGGG